MPFYFYFARCNDGSLYAGSCIDTKKREAAHNRGDGAKYTRAKRPVKIIYTEQFTTLTKARRREAQVKGWTKEKKEKLVKGLL
ncbi:MAG: GIY-YIG nuclease family protein [Candidatus Peregrinibacteria bacterium]